MCVVSIIAILNVKIVAAVAYELQIGFTLLHVAEQLYKNAALATLSVDPLLCIKSCLLLKASTCRTMFPQNTLL